MAKWLGLERIEVADVETWRGAWRGTRGSHAAQSEFGFKGICDGTKSPLNRTAPCPSPAEGVTVS